MFGVGLGFGAGACAGAGVGVGVEYLNLQDFSLVIVTQLNIL